MWFVISVLGNFYIQSSTVRHENWKVTGRDIESYFFFLGMFSELWDLSVLERLEERRTRGTRSV